MGNSIDYGIVLGISMSGKSQICQVFCESLGYEVIDSKIIREQLAAAQAEKEEIDPAEVEVSVDSINNKIASIIESKMDQIPRPKFICDGPMFSNP